MRRSLEIEALVRRFLHGMMDREMELNVLSTSPGFLTIGTDEREWWRGRDELMAVEDAAHGEMEQHRGDIGSPLIHIAHVEAFESGEIGWAAARYGYAMAAPSDPVQLRSTFVLLLEAGMWRILRMHHSIGVLNEDIFGLELTTNLDELVSSLDSEARDTIAATAPVGTATVMFTDIENSTRISEAVGDEAWMVVVKSHFEILRRIVEAEGGTVVKMLGDGGMFTFASARAGLSAAVRIQRTESTTPRDTSFTVRVGLHSGDVLRSEGDYVGATLNKAARIAAAANGGEIMVSAVTVELAGRHDFNFGESMTVTLRGLEGTHTIVPLLWEQP